MTLWTDLGVLLGELVHKILRFRPSKRFIQGLLFIIILILSFNIYRERETLFLYKWHVSWKHLLAAVIFHWTALVLMQSNWHSMISYFGGNINWQKNYYVYGLSLAARRMPAPLFDLGARFFLYASDEPTPRVIAFATSLELGLIGFSGVLCYLLFLPFYSTIPINLPWWIFLLLGLVIATGLILFPKLLVVLLNHFLRWIRRTSIDIKVEGKNLLHWLIVYLAVWIIDGFSLFLTVGGLVEGVFGWGDVMAVSTLSALVGFVSQFLPAGFGLKEMVSGSLFTQWVPLGVGIVLAVGFRLLMTIVEIVWALVCYVFWGDKRKPVSIKE